jgi:hypothetical protein
MRRIVASVMSTILALAVPQPTSAATGTPSVPEASKEPPPGRCVVAARPPKVTLAESAILVKFGPLVTESTKAQVAIERSLAEERRLLTGGWIRYRLTEGMDPFEMANEVARDPRSRLRSANLHWRVRCVSRHAA